MTAGAESVPTAAERALTGALETAAGVAEAPAPGRVTTRPSAASRARARETVTGLTR